MNGFELLSSVISILFVMGIAIGVLLVTALRVPAVTAAAAQDDSPKRPRVPGLGLPLSGRRDYLGAGGAPWRR